MDKKRLDHDKYLLERERKICQAIINDSDDIVFVINAKGRIIFLNPKVLHFLGYSTKELDQKPIINFLPDEEKKRLSDCFFNKKVTSDFINQSIEVLNINGEKIKFYLKILLPYPDNKIFNEKIGIIKTLKNNKYNADKIKFNSIINSIDEGYFEVDLKGTLTFCNDKLSKMISVPLSDIIGVNFKKFVTQETADQMFRFFNKTYTSGNPTKIVNYELKKKNGSLLNLEIVASLIYDSKQIPSGFRGIARDVTKIKKAAELIKKQQVQMFQAQRIESIGTLAGGIAHDFNNLLMAIQGNISLLLLNKSQKDTDLQKLSNIENYIYKGAELTKQLLGFARRGKYETAVISLNEIVINCAKFFGRAKKEVEISLDLKDKLWPVKVDHGQIKQVILNICVNSGQAMPDGGELFIKTKNVVLKKEKAIEYNIKAGKYVSLAIKDTGEGIDEQILQRVFEPFFSTKDVGLSSGLGLASAYGIIKNHKGFITVKSKRNHGTTFLILIPAINDNIKKTPKNISNKIIKGCENILFIDDESAILDIGAAMLTSLGYGVTTAINGIDAIDEYKRNHDKYDLVILDMIMPKMNGREICEKLKNINPKIKVILSSGYSLESQAIEIIKLGCIEFIQKPFDIKKLSQKVSEALRNVN